MKADCDTSVFPIAIEVVDCGLEAAEVDNLAVTDVRTAKNLIRPGEQVDLVADIVNTGDVATEKTSVEWLLADKVVHTDADRRACGRCEDASDRVGADAGCRNFFRHLPHYWNGSKCRSIKRIRSLIEVADELPILFVEGNTGAKPSVAASELFAAALGFKNNEPQAWHSVYRPEVISLAALPAHPLAGYRAIVINNLDELDAATRDRLDSFRARGRRTMGGARRGGRSHLV